MAALALNDHRWTMLKGGYRVLFDASEPLRALASGAEPGPIWKVLWQELHHQGDVGEASYAAVPSLISICIERGIVDWNLFALVGAIECCRKRPTNPPLPDWLEDAYAESWEPLFQFGLEALRGSGEELLVRAVLPIIAIHRGLDKLGCILSELETSEIEEIYRRVREEW
jgi:hypothetical protein